MDRLSTLIELGKTMNRLKVDDARQANYLDKENRASELQDFAGYIASISLPGSLREDYYDSIEESLEHLGMRYRPEEKLLIKNNQTSDSTILMASIASSVVSFVLGWKANDFYSELLRKTMEKDVEDISKYVKDNLNDYGTNNHES
jgi:hypothetical protein